MYICLCKGLTESEIRKAALEADLNVTLLIQALGLDDTDCCGRCARNIEGVVSVVSCPLPCHTTDQPQTR